jgi:hypothetical protein
MLTTYKVSKKEIIRREKAFWALSVSLFLGSILASILFNFPISYLFFGGFAGVLLLLNLWIKKFFNKFLKLKIGLSKEFLVKTNKKFLIKNIKKVKIKWTTNKTIREIGIFFNDGKSLFINGLNRFEKFRKKLLKKVNKKVVIKNTYEPMNFDSIFFYPILGLILSFGTVYLLKLMAGFSYQTMQIVLYVSVAYVFLMGIYLILSKPISKRY